MCEMLLFVQVVPSFHMAKLLVYRTLQQIAWQAWTLRLNLAKAYQLGAMVVCSWHTCSICDRPEIDKLLVRKLQRESL